MSMHLHRTVPHLLGNIASLALAQAFIWYKNISWWISIVVYYASFSIIEQLNSLIKIKMTVVGASGGLFALFGYLAFKDEERIALVGVLPMFVFKCL